MATHDTESSSESSSSSRFTSDIVTPPNRTATVWKYFGFKKDQQGKLIKNDRAFCKVCGTSVAHGGGTTNLRNHLRASRTLRSLLRVVSESNVF